MKWLVQFAAVLTWSVKQRVPVLEGDSRIGLVRDWFLVKMERD